VERGEGERRKREREKERNMERGCEEVRGSERWRWKLVIQHG
jgi:hypothetical protein